VQPGFRLLTDLTGLESMDAECAPYIGTVMEVLTEHNLRQAARVIVGCCSESAHTILDGVLRSE
jgi:hypothetical protein